MGRAATTGPKQPRVARGRVNWRSVLARMPRQFKASDVQKVRGLETKHSSEIFAGIWRWIDAGLARRKSRGVYVKV